jgi:hypothetical protein
MFEYLKVAEQSFKASIRGEEKLSVIIRWWGIIGYLVFYFIVNKLIQFNKITVIDIFLSSLAIVYFSWHIFALKRCSPKKPKLTKEEKKLIKLKNEGQFWKSFMRKLLLQEPITKWNTVSVLIALDLLYIVIFLEYIIR